MIENNENIDPNLIPKNKTKFEHSSLPTKIQYQGKSFSVNNREPSKKKKNTFVGWYRCSCRAKARSQLGCKATLTVNVTEVGDGSDNIVCYELGKNEHTCDSGYDSVTKRTKTVAAKGYCYILYI